MKRELKIDYYRIMNQIKVIESKCSYLSIKREESHHKTMYAINNQTSVEIKACSTRDDFIRTAFDVLWKRINALHDKLDVIKKEMSNYELLQVRRPDYFLRHGRV